MKLTSARKEVCQDAVREEPSARAAQDAEQRQQSCTGAAAMVGTGHTTHLGLNCWVSVQSIGIQEEK